MTSFRARRTPALLALSCVGAMLSPMAHAQTAEQSQPSLGGDVITYDDLEEEPGRQQETPKATRPVRDTPQTVTILTGQQIEQQNLLTLRDVLSTVPGITFGAGEGGGGYGDSINLRGYNANADITQDGVRDSAQYSRTDPFNIEQIEVTNGANGAIAGSGSVGGSINIVTKRPRADDRVALTAGIGTDEYYRGTIDANLRLNDLIAVRLNAMGHRNDVPGRDVENYKRWGIAPSVTIGIESPTSLTLQYLHQEDDNIPQYGAPYVAALGGLVPGADIDAYYGYRNIDTQESTIDQVSAIFEHEFSDNVKIRNLTRWQDVTQLTLVSPPQGTYCLDNGLQANGTPCVATINGEEVTIPAGYFYPSGPRGSTRDTRNQLAFTQFDLMANFDTGGVSHTLVLGGALSWEKFELATSNWKRNADGTAPIEPLINIANPNEIIPGPAGFAYGSNIWTGPVNILPTARQTGELKNYAVYLFDTMAFTEQFELNFGLRYERNSGWFRADTIAGATATSPGTFTPGTKFWNTDDLFSYRVGLVYKPIEAVSAYIAYGNSKTPSKTSVNGSCDATSCNVDPETAVNYEAGIKWEVGDGALLTLAVFRNERQNYRVASADPTVPEQQLDGRSRVNGFTLGANGRIMPNWTITANYTYLDSEVLQNAATGAADDPQKGAPLTNTPKHSGSLFTAYTLPFGLQIGYGFTYQGKFYLNNTGPILYQVDDYLIHNAYLAYSFTENVNLQLNLKNFTDERYFTGVRNGATANPQWARVGDGFSAIATLNLTF